VERRLIRMLADAEDFKVELARRLQQERLYEGMEAEKIIAAMIAANLAAEPVSSSEVAATLDERDRRLFFEVLFEEEDAATWEEAESCLAALQRRQVERAVAEVQRDIEAQPAGANLRGLLELKQELMRRLAAH
jgi:hypothetical protein